MRTVRAAVRTLLLGVLAFGADKPNYPWPAHRAIYEVNVDYYPQHSFRELAADTDRLRRLGINVMYVMPFFESAPGARYLITDYYKIDPRYGSEDDLKRMVRAAHANGIRVLLDFVTSLTWDRSVIYKQHPDWILKGDNGRPQRFYPFPDWGWALDCANPEVIDYFSKVARHYVQKFDVDGWRIDSPMNNYDPEKVSTDHSRLNLLRAVKAAILRVKPERLFLCELSGPTLMWGKDDANELPLYDEVCQASYDFPFCGFLGGEKDKGFHYLFFEGSPAHGKFQLTPLDSIAHNRASSKQLARWVNDRKTLHDATRAIFIENHDTERVSYAFPEVHRALFVLAATIPGIPVVHAGQEVGTTHPAGHAPRKPKDGNIVIPRQERGGEMEDFYRKILSVREATPALVYGDMSDVLASGDQPLAYLRTFGNSRVIVVVNPGRDSSRAAISLPLEQLRLDARRTWRLRDLLDNDSRKISRDELKRIDVPVTAYGFRILSLE